jgi:hypothetical protein
MVYDCSGRDQFAQRSKKFVASSVRVGAKIWSPVCGQLLHVHLDKRIKCLRLYLYIIYNYEQYDAFQINSG